MRLAHFILLSGLCPLAVSAQRDKDTVTNRQVEIVETYKPKFMDVQKIEAVPVLVKPQLKPQSFSYQINARQISTDKIVKPMPVAELALSEDFSYPNSFIKLGYGNIRTPLAEVYLNNKQSSKYSYGAHYRFLQSNSDLNNSYADFSRHHFKGYASTYTQFGELGLDMNFRQQDYFLYGYNQKDTGFEASRDRLGRTMKSFDARAYFNSTAIGKRKLKHRSQFNFYNFSIDKATESQYALSSKLYAGVPNFNDLKNCMVSAQIGLDYNLFRNDTQNIIKRLFIQFDPRFDFEYEGLQISAGFNTTVFIKGDSSKTYVNPVIKASYPLIEGVANLYAGIDGRYQKQSLKNIIQSNAFTRGYPLNNLYENVKTYLGLNAKMGSSADAVFEIGYSDISNMPLFITADTQYNSFGILYKQVSMLKFMAAFNYSFSEKVRIGVLGNFYNYEVTDEPYAWQLPNMDGKLNMQFNIRDRLYPHIDIVAFGVQKQRSGAGSNYAVNSMEAFYDLSAGLDYRFKKKLSAFVQANNLLDKRYQRWYNYPVYGFNIIGGITMIF